MVKAFDVVQHDAKPIKANLEHEAGISMRGLIQKSGDLLQTAIILKTPLIVSNLLGGTEACRGLGAMHVHEHLGHLFFG